MASAQCLVDMIDAEAPILTGISSEPAGWAPKKTVTIDGVTDKRTPVPGPDGTIIDYTGTGSESVKREWELDGTYNAFTGNSFPVTENGTHYIYYKVTDKAGNVTTGYSGLIKVDTKEPTLEVTGGDTGAAKLTLKVDRSFGPSDGKVTVNSGDQDVAGNYVVNTKGKYIFTAVSGAGKKKVVEKDVCGITFDSKCNDNIPGQIVVKGGKAMLPPNPKKDGYTFEKWQRNNKEFDFGTDTIMADTTLTAVWTLDAPTVNLSVDHAKATYNGGETVATLTATPSHNASDVNWSYTWYRNEEELSGTDSILHLTDTSHSGTYKVKVTAQKDGQDSVQVSNEVEVAISKADTRINAVPEAAAITYGDALSSSVLTGGTGVMNAQSLSGRLANAFSGEKQVEGSFNWTDGSVTPTVADSGTTQYSLTFTPKDEDNYNASTATITLTVNRKHLIPSVNTVQDKEYDGNTTASGAISLTGSVLEEKPAAKGTFEFTDQNVSTSKSVNVSDISLDDTWGDNYMLSVESLAGVETKAQITPKQVALQWSGQDGLVYTGSPVNVTAKATEVIEPDVCTVTVNGGTETNAGTYTANAAALSNKNYALPSVTEQSYTIAKAPVTFSVTENTHDYDETEKTASVLQTANQTPDVSGKFEVTYKKEGVEVQKPVNAGTYDVMVELTDDNFEHSGRTERKIPVGTLTINKVEYPAVEKGTMKWPEAAELTYGQFLSDSTLSGDGIESQEKGSYAWSKPETRPTVGNDGYSVTFTPADTSYLPAHHTVMITVAQKELTVSGATARDRDYIPADTTVTVSGGQLDGLEERDVVTLNDNAASGSVVTPDADTAKEVTVTGYNLVGEDAGNYYLTQPTGLTVNIRPAEGTGSVAMANWIYGDPAAEPVPDSLTNGIDQVTYTYQGVNTAGTYYPSSATRPLDAGSYKVTAVYPATNNYKVVTATADFTITRRPLTLQWSELYHTYDGSTAVPRAELVNRISSDGEAQCHAAVIGVKNRINAGRYTITAELEGDKAHNYSLAEPNEVLVIEPAPVSVTVSDYSHKQDGNPKSAVITAVPDVAKTVTYQLAGKNVTDPAEAGMYDIMVGLDSENYRFAGSADGRRRKLGVLTIYENKPPQTYTITFKSGAEDAVGTAPAITASVAGTIHMLPDNTFTRPDFAFTGWKSGSVIYQPQERFVQPANNNTVFTAQWKENTFDIGGVVDQDGNAMANVKVVLMRGAEQVADTVTDQKGEYVFTGVLPGVYNLVATKPVEEGNIIQTTRVDVTSADVDKVNITLPLGQTNSVVRVEPGTPKIIVGNLEQTFAEVDGTVYTESDQKTILEGGSVEICFKAEQKEDSQLTEEETEAIAQSAGSAKIGLYMTLDLQKTVTEAKSAQSEVTPVPESNVLLEMVIPLPRELRGKQSYSVVRIHDDSVETLDSTPNSDGEFIETDSEKTTITLHAKKFSTYAVAYTEKSSTGGHGGSGGGGSFVPKKRPQPTLPTETSEEMTEASLEVILTEVPEETKTEKTTQPKTTQFDESQAAVADGGEIPETSVAAQLPDEENHMDQHKDDGPEEPKERDAVCSLCHICPTFLGVCLFVWLAIAAALVILWVCWKKRKEQEEKSR